MFNLCVYYITDRQINLTQQPVTFSIARIAKKRFPCLTKYAQIFLLFSNSIGNRNQIGVMQENGIILCNNSPFVHYGAVIVRYEI